MADTKISYDDEIDLFALFETLWDGKWKIIFMTFAAALVGIAVSVFKPNVYDVSLNFNSASYSNFTKYVSLNSIFEENDLEYKVDAETIFDSFITEFNEYDELLKVLKKDPHVINLLEDLEPKKIEKEVAGLAKLFSIKPPLAKATKPPLAKATKAVIAFTWHDADQGKVILGKAMELVLANMRDAILNDVEILATSIETRKQRRTKQLSTIIYAMEQVREYNSMNAQPSNESGYSMVGGYVEAKIELATIQSDVSAELLRSNMAIIKSDNYKGWIVYDLDLADVKSQNKPFLYITLASVLGGFIGVAYVLIVNAARTRKERLASA